MRPKQEQFGTLYESAKIVVELIEFSPGEIINETVFKAIQELKNEVEHMQKHYYEYFVKEST